MPLPRFGRLPLETQVAILAVARTHFARYGLEGASYGKIIAEVGMSKTSAYHYFDGKFDLYEAVVLDVTTRVRTVLGTWRPAEGPAEFWEAVARTGQHLLAHLAAHPDDRALLARAPAVVDPVPWTVAMVSDAVRLGLIPEDEQDLMLALTPAVLDALDRYVLDGDHPDRELEATAQLPRLLARLWGAATPTDKSGYSSGQRPTDVVGEE